MATEVHTKNLDGNMTKDSAVTHNMSITSASPLESSASLKGKNITDKGNNEHLIIKQDKYYYVLYTSKTKYFIPHIV